MNPNPKLKTKAKLTPQQVLEIRERYNLGRGDISMDKLAVIYGVRPTTIWKMIHNENWKDIGGPVFKSR